MQLHGSTKKFRTNKPLLYFTPKGKVSSPPWFLTLSDNFGTIPKVYWQHSGSHILNGMY